MNRGKIILIIVLVLIAFFYIYHNTKFINTVDSYDFVTLVNIESTLDRILYEYENGEDNEQILHEYFNKFYTYSWYLSISPRLRVTYFKVSRIPDILDDGITEEELNYLVSVRDNLEIFIKRLNEEWSKPAFLRTHGIFSKSDIEELKKIYDGNI